MTYEARTVIETSCTYADVPPRPSILAQLESAIAVASEASAKKARAVQMVIERNAAIQSGRVAKASEHMEKVIAFLRKRGGLVRISDMVVHLKTKHGVDVHSGDLGKALFRTPGVEREEVRGRACWRAV